MFAAVHLQNLYYPFVMVSRILQVLTASASDGDTDLIALCLYLVPCRATCPALAGQGRCHVVFVFDLILTQRFQLT